jgi:hypothetical protein
MWKLLLLLIPITVCSCSTNVEVTTTHFHKLPKKGNGEVFTLITKKNPSMEHQAYMDRIIAGFEKYGWKYSPSKKSPYIVAVICGMPPGRTVHGVRPVIGKISAGGTTYHSGTVNTGLGEYSSFRGTSYTPATYGVVGAVPTQETVYDRLLYVLVLGPGASPLLDSKCESTGSSSNLSQIMPIMIDAFFHKFPGESGKTTTYSRRLR